MAYVDTEKIKKALNNFSHIGTGDVRYDCGYDDCMTAVVDTISDLPTDDVAEVRHGKWIDRYSEKYDNHLYECSECRKKALYDARGDELGNVKITQVLSPVCPWCGAKMDEKEE